MLIKSGIAILFPQPANDRNLDLPSIGRSTLDV